MSTTHTKLGKQLETGDKIVTWFAPKGVAIEGMAEYVGPDVMLRGKAWTAWFLGLDVSMTIMSEEFYEVV